MRALSPNSLVEALAYLADDPSLVPVAGCTDLMVGGATAMTDVSGVLDLAGVGELRGIRPTAAGLEIGATTTFADIGRSLEIVETYPALAQAAALIGGWQIQNRATLGGNIANASPAGDSLPVLLVLEAEVTVVSAAGTRTVRYLNFHRGYRQTALEPGEIIGWVLLPHLPEGSTQAFRKVGTRRAQAISKVVVAMLGRVEAGRFVDFRLAAGSVAEVPIRFPEVEKSIRVRPADRSTADLAGRLAAQEARPITDVRSTAEYRRFALERVVRRLTLELAAGRPYFSG